MRFLQCFLVFSATLVVYSASAEDALSDNSTTTESLINSTTVTVSTSSSTDPVTDVSTTPASNITAATTEASTTPALVSTTTTESPGPADLMLVVNSSGNACIIAKMEITLTIEYQNTNESMVIGTFPITSATVNLDKSSKCSSPTKDEEEELYADFSGNNSLYFLFDHTSANKFAVTLFKLSSSDLKNLFPDAMDQTLNLMSNGSIFETSSNMSYKCNSQTKVNLVNADGMATNSSVVFKMVQVEAFRTKNDTNFANAIDCEADEDIDNIVPIAVGCALAGLVVIVLIAYLVGRRQKRQRGYESV